MSRNLVLLERIILEIDILIIGSSCTVVEAIIVFGESIIEEISRSLFSFCKFVFQYVFF